MTQICLSIFLYYIVTTKCAKSTVQHDNLHEFAYVRSCRQKGWKTEMYTVLTFRQICLNDDITRVLWMCQGKDDQNNLLSQNMFTEYLHLTNVHY